MNILTDNVQALIDFINTNLLGLTCDDDDNSLNQQIDDAIGVFSALINTIKSDIDIILENNDLSKSIKKHLETFNDYLTNLINMTSSFTITEAVDEYLLTDIILILINTTLSLVEITELIISIDIANGEGCGEIGEKIDLYIDKCICEKLSCFFKLLCDWKKLLIYWINKVSDIDTDDDEDND